MDAPIAEAPALIRTLTAQHADALILEEEIVGTEMRPRSEGGGFDLSLTMRARVLDRSRSDAAGFRTELSLERTRFVDGDGVTLSVRASENARLYVIAVGATGATVLLPNAHRPDTRAPAQEWIHFPDDRLRERGVRLVARVAPGSSRSQEVLIAVALRGDRLLTGLLPAVGETHRSAESRGAGALLDEVLGPLADLPPEAWAFDQVAYEVVAQ